MKQGAGSAVGLFAVVLAVTGGLGWLLYEVGGGDAEPAANGPASAKTAHKNRNRADPPPPEENSEIPPHLRVKPVPPEGAPRIPIPGHDDLKLRNWKEVAGAIADMRSVSREMIELGPPKDDSARVETMQRRMQHFISAVVMRPGGVESTKTVTTPQHPAFAVNAVASLLEHENLPLTEAQTKRLADLAIQRGPPMEAAEAEMTKDDPSTWYISRVAAYAVLTDEFYAELHAVLTPAQSEVISPADLRGRQKLDMLSSGSPWGRICRPLLFSDDQKLVEMLTAGLASLFTVPDRKDEIRPIVAAWVHDGGFAAADALDVKGFTRTSYVPPAVPRTIELFTRVLEGLQLPAEAVAIAHGVNTAYIPLRQ